MSDKEYPEELFSAKRLSLDVLDNILGGFESMAQGTLFKEQCACGWASEAAPAPAQLSACPSCGAGGEQLSKYAFLHGEWVKME